MGRHHWHINIIKAIVKTVKVVAKAVVKVVKKVVDAVKAIAKKAAAWATKTWNAAKKAVANAAKKAYAWTKAAVAKAGKWIAAAAKSLKDAVAKAWNAAKAFAAKAVAAMKSAWEACKKAVTSALNAVAEWAKKAAQAVLKALCKGLQWALDKVVAAAFSALAKAAVGAICFAGRMVAKALNAVGGLMDNLFRMERIYYAGSLSQAVKGNFGRLEFSLWMMIMDNIVSVAVDKIAGLLGAKSPSPPPSTNAPAENLAPPGYGTTGPPPVKVYWKPTR